MPGPAWGEDTARDRRRIRRNVRTLLADLHSTAGLRVTPTLGLAHDWHRRSFAGVSSVPGPHYLGAYRGSGHPDLDGYDVVLGDSRGRVVAQAPPAHEVAAHLTTVEQALQRVTTTLDAAIAPGHVPATSSELQQVIALCAQMHGEWVRVHPYANGNGRTARTWANWVALRYGLPPFVRIKPRPDGTLYGAAARSSMGVPPDHVGDHTATFLLFLDLLSNAP